jgi:cobalamin synthase
VFTFQTLKKILESFDSILATKSFMKKVKTIRDVYIGAGGIFCAITLTTRALMFGLEII